MIIRNTEMRIATIWAYLTGGGCVLVAGVVVDVDGVVRSKEPGNYNE